jgi:hypothetical protein
VEQYVLDGLAATADGVLAGSGALVVMLVSVLSDLAGTVVLDEMEQAAVTGGRELARRAMQHALDAQAGAEVRVAAVTGADGVRRSRAERGHARTVTTMLGQVRVRRIGYRAGVKGVPSLFPRDAVLNLPPVPYSWQLQRLAVMFTRCGSYEQAHELVLAATGVSIGKRQLEQITAAAAADAERFCQDQDRGPVQDQGLVALSADGKGVAMRPEARRRRTKDPARQSRAFRKRRGPSEPKGKRMAETGCVFDVQPADPAGPARTPETIMRPDPDPAPRPAAPRAVNRWYTCDITADRAVTIGRIFDEGERRDPCHERTWIALADGDNHQIALFQAGAAARCIPLTIIIDFIHVLEYLWKAAWCFHQPRDPAMEDWVCARALDILHGRAGDVITVIEDLAAAHPPAGPEHAKIIRTTLHYLAAKQPYMDYPRALANGWPIATGVIEGACRHLVQDRMGITGARWGLPGAQAILWLRALHASGDHDTYWTWHIQQEHHRNHLSQYQDTLTLAA